MLFIGFCQQPELPVINGPEYGQQQKADHVI
jgi:hypothetical protein